MSTTLLHAEAPAQTPPSRAAPPQRARAEIQRSSTVRVTQPEEAVERDADQLADLVAPRQSGSSELRRSPFPFAPSSVWDALSAPSRWLAADERRLALGVDPSAVRVHDGDQAAASARALGAAAYTVGDHIVLGEGHDAHSANGRRVLAHELAHVAQQRSDRASAASGSAELVVARHPGPAPRHASGPQGAPQMHAAADAPAEMLEAIVHVLSVRDLDIGLAQDVGPGGEQISAPGYYTDIKKSIHDPGHVALLWEWHRLAAAQEPDGKGGYRPIEAQAARRRIDKAVADTSPVLVAVGAGKGTDQLVARYRKGVEVLTQRAAREEVSAAFDVGMAHERLRPERLEKKPENEEEEIKSLAEKALDLNLELVEASHKVSEHYGEVVHEIDKHARELYEERLNEYLRKVFKENHLDAEAPGPLIEESHSFVTGMAFVKGGLDATLAILAVKDPKERAELFASHRGLFGKIGGTAEIGKVLLQFASASVAFYGASTYSIAKLGGNEKLAEEVLDLTVHRVGTVANGLYLVGAIHGIAVLLDPTASSEAKGEAAVETVTNVVALAGTAGRWIPMLEEVAGWSGPIAAALSINWVLLKEAARAYEGTKEGIASLGGSYYREEAWQAAVEVQEWIGRLAVTKALLAVESDTPRKKQLEAFRLSFRTELVNNHLKPYFVALFAPGKDEEGKIGLKARLRLVVPLVDAASNSDEDALEAGRAFLETVRAAFEQWGKVVLTVKDPTNPEQFIGHRGVVVKKIWRGEFSTGVVHIRNDANTTAGRAASVAPDEPYFKAGTVGSSDYPADLLPGQVVRVNNVERGEVWVSLDSLQTPVLEVTAEEKQQAERL